MIATGAFIGILSLIYVITAALLKIPVGILNWVVNTPVSITHANVVVRGWEVCRDLVNIVFVLALVFIAIATILKMRSYAMEKSLPGLLIVAILINFTPVICGFIIDIATVVMNIFKTAAIDGINFFANDPFKNTFYPSVLDTLQQFVFNSNSIAQGLIGRLIAGITFNVLTFFVLAVYALIFFLRIMVLWALVIFSPFAFFGLFFPIAKGLWKEWSKQFFNWTFIGIPLFFFLYLSKIVIDNPVCQGTIPTGSTLNSWLNEQSMCSILGLIFPTFFLLIGLGATFMLGTKGTGADKILSFGEKTARGWGKQAGKFATSQTLGRFTSSEKGKEFMRGLENIGIAKDGGKYKDWAAMTNSEKVKARGTAPLRWAMRPIATVGLKYSAKQSKGISAKIKEFEDTYGKDYKSAAATYYNLKPTDYEGKIALGQYLAKTKGSLGLEKLSREQLRDVIKTTAHYSPKQLEDIIKYYPDLITDHEVGSTIQDTLVDDPTVRDSDYKKVNDMFPGLTDVRYKELTAYRKAADALDATDAAGYSDDMINNNDFMDMVILLKNPGFIRKVAEEKGSDFTGKFNDRLRAGGLRDKMIFHNKALASIVKTPQASTIFESDNIVYIRPKI